MSDITQSERRELRSVVKGQYRVLRAEVKRREQELRAEIEEQILDRYREQDAAIGEAKREAQREIADCVRRIEEIADRLRAVHPTVETQVGYGSRGFVTAPFQPGDRVIVTEDGIYGPLRLWRGTSGVIRSVYPPLVAARLGYDFTAELDAGQFPGEPLQPAYVAIGMRYGEVVADPRAQSQSAEVA